MQKCVDYTSKFVVKFIVQFKSVFFALELFEQSKLKFKLVIIEPVKFQQQFIFIAIIVKFFQQQFVEFVKQSEFLKLQQRRLGAGANIQKNSYAGEGGLK